ncbi:MAG: DUF433 domain-containing protein [Fidelibacterota bacterium]
MEKLINVDKEILGGTVVFMGTRVPVKNLFDYLEEGESISEFLEDFPTVKERASKFHLADCPWSQVFPKNLSRVKYSAQRHLTG